VTGSGVVLSSSGFNLNANGSVVRDTSDPNTVLFDRGKRVPNNGSATIDVTGTDFASGRFDVYVYFDSRAENSIGDDLTLSFAIGATTYYVDLPGGVATYTGSFERVTSQDAGNPGTGNYVLFEDLTAASFSLEIGSSGSSNNNNGAVIAGLQVVEVPEPGVAMLAWSGAWLLLRRRRR